MAGYIARNMWRPKPEWQQNRAKDNGAANPFKIIHGSGRSTPHPLIGKRFPLVLMLEPLHACNLTCTGCGRIREYENTIGEQVPLEKCLAAIDECGAPVVAIAGGEPFLYKDVVALAEGAVARARLVYLCTNGMFLRKRAREFTPHKNFFFNVHLDGMEKSHDLAVEREGVFKEAIEGIKVAKQLGFKVSTNTTVYKETDMAEIEEMFAFLATLGVDGHQIAPGYGYSAVNDREIFLTRDDIIEKFRQVSKLGEKYPVSNSPLYLDFLRGERDLPCTAWGNPTYNTKGWKGPCYLITDGHYDTFEELMTKTPWESYGRGNDPRCEHCMVHCGYEASAALGINSKTSDTLKLVKWALR
jgi:hopanoid biosynthesis associated radical SAM protein HpnH